MKFQIDGRFIAIHALECAVYYAMGVLIVFAICNVNDPIGFIGASFIAATALYTVYFYPRAICINDGIILMKKNNSWKKVKVKLSDIVTIQTNSKFYNTVTISTKSGVKYHLHPRDVVALENAIESKRQ